MLVLRSWLIQEGCEVQINGRYPQIISKMRTFKLSTFRKWFKLFAGITSVILVELQKQKYDLWYIYVSSENDSWHCKYVVYYLSYGMTCQVYSVQQNISRGHDFDICHMQLYFAIYLNNSFKSNECIKCRSAYLVL